MDKLIIEMRTEEYIPLIQQYFKHKPVLKAYFFGSVLQPSFNDKSDVDIMVELDYKNGGADFFSYIEMQEDLTLLIKRKVDLISANGLSDRIKPLVENSKKLVYERQR